MFFLEEDSVSVLSRTLITLTVLACASSAWANPFPAGNREHGRSLHASKCVSCHNSMMPGNRGEELYDEFNRKVKTISQLRGMVDFCANRTKTGWFDEEVISVSRYLNDQHYQFK